MFIVLGLGNPGREYQNTRHNIGFMTLDILADRYHIDVCRHNFRSVFGEGRIGSERVALAKPETFMNNSGWAARDLVNWYKCKNSELIVVYDDIDIPIESNDPSLDRRHCYINVKKNKQGKIIYTLRDNDSITGTFLMNEILGPKDQIRIEDGAIITLGATTLILRAAEGQTEE